MPNPVKSVINKIRSPGSRSPPDAASLEDRPQPAAAEGTHSAPVVGGADAASDRQSTASASTPHKHAAAGQQRKHADDLRSRLSHLVPHSSRHSADIDRTRSFSPTSESRDHSPGSHSPHGRKSFDLFGRNSVGGAAAGGGAAGGLSRLMPSTSRKHKEDANSSDKGSGKDTPLDDNARARKVSDGGPSERTKQKMNAKLERHQKEEEEHEHHEKLRLQAYEADPLKAHYGLLPITSLGDTKQAVLRHKLDDLESLPEGTETQFRARVHHIRRISAKVAFIVFRHGLSTLQGVVAVKEDQVSENMVRWAEKLSLETVVLVHGYVKKPKGQTRVKSCTVHDVEVAVDRIHIAGTVTTQLPFHVEDVEKPTYAPDTVVSDGLPADQQPKSGTATPDSSSGADHATEPSTSHNKHIGHQRSVGYTTRLDNRVIDLRSDVSQSIFRISAAVGRFFRQHLDNNGFTEIHTSKFQGGATESGASVFKVDYFGRPAFLAQSPQLGKQMAIAADMERVYEIGPVFRAENSNTHRHLTEFTGLDLEMAIDDHYHEVVDMLDGALLNIFRGIQTHYRRELDAIRKLYPSEDLVFPDKTLRLHFHDGVQMLRDSGWTDEGEEIGFYEDFSTRTEKRLGQLVKEKYGTDYYILDKFPASARPFYTMPDPHDPKVSNSCDFFIRGEEILSGGQRIHQAPLLVDRMKALNMDPDTMKEYVDAFRLGCPPHGGGGIGLERVVFLFLKLGNIRWATMFPRDPRSFPMDARRQALAMQPSDLMKRGPVADTLEYAEKKNAGKQPPLPKLEDLIAAYGDSPNTSWLDPFWTVWRDEETGGAVGYATSEKFAVCWGRPLCSDRQLLTCIQNFLTHMKQKHLKPIFACIDSQTEQILEQDLNWNCVVAVAEQRVDPVTLTADGDEKVVRQKIHKAQRAGVKVIEKDGDLSEAEQKEVRQRMKEWQQHRSGTQVYSAGLRPFDDPEHRKYFLARDKENQICGLVVLAQLSRDHGYQVKYSLDFPNAPSGTIELIVTEALHSLGKSGVHAATFGGSAPEEIRTVGKDFGIKAKMLSKSYSVITRSFRLTDKATFRQKFGATPDPQYVAYPKGGLGLKGIEAIMKVLQSEK